MTTRTKIGCALLLLTAFVGRAYGQENAPAEQPQARIVVFRDSLSVRHCDTPPVFRHKDLRAFSEWVNRQIEKPQPHVYEHLFPRVVVSFVIDTTGRLTGIRVLQTPDRSFSAEAVRVLKRSPRWKPGRLNGRKIPVEIMLPVDFRR